MIAREHWLDMALLLTRAKWRAPRSARVSTLEKNLTAPTLLEMGFFNNYDFTERGASVWRPFPCCVFHSDRLRTADGFLSVKVMRSFLNGLPAILDKCLLSECRFVDGYVEYVLSFSDLS